MSIGAGAPEALGAPIFASNSAGTRGTRPAPPNEEPGPEDDEVTWSALPTEEPGPEDDEVTWSALPTEEPGPEDDEVTWSVSRDAAAAEGAEGDAGVGTDGDDAIGGAEPSPARAAPTPEVALASANFAEVAPTSANFADVASPVIGSSRTVESVVPAPAVNAWLRRTSADKPARFDQVAAIQPCPGESVEEAAAGRAAGVGSRSLSSGDPTPPALSGEPASARTARGRDGVFCASARPAPSAASSTSSVREAASSLVSPLARDIHVENDGS
jgi:hypothetical protein